MNTTTTTTTTIHPTTPAAPAQATEPAEALVGEDADSAAESLARDCVDELAPDPETADGDNPRASRAELGQVIDRLTRAAGAAIVDTLEQRAEAR